MTHRRDIMGASYSLAAIALVPSGVCHCLALVGKANAHKQRYISYKGLPGVRQTLITRSACSAGQAKQDNDSLRPPCKVSYEMGSITNFSTAVNGGESVRGFLSIGATAHARKKLRFESAYLTENMKVIRDGIL